METKYKKVKVQKENIGQKLICINKSGIIEIGIIYQSRLDYSFTCISKLQGKESYMYDVTHYLIEVPDREDEMLQMLKHVLALAQCGNIVDAYTIENLIKEATELK